MQRPIIGGSTDKSVVIRIIDSTDGTPETGVTFETSGLSLWYRREGGDKVSITPATLAAINSAHSDGGIIHIGDGYYRLDPPDAAIAAGADGVMFGGAVTGMIVIGCYIQIVSEGASAAALQTVDDNVDTLVSRLTAARAGYIDKLNVSGTLAHSDAAATYRADVSSIPTNPLLTNDERLDNLDAAVSSRSSHSAADVWSVTTRTLSSFGSLVSDIASAVWGYGTRTLSSFGSLVSNIWSNVSRTITGGTIDVCSLNSDMRGTDGAVTSLSGVATEENQTIINNNVLTRSVFDHTSDEVITDTASRNASKADVSALALEASIEAVDNKIDAMQLNVTEILDYSAGNWAIINNQMIFYTKAGVELQRFNLTKDGEPDSTAPDARTRVV